MPVNRQASGTRMLIGSVTSAEDGGWGIKDIETPLSKTRETEMQMSTSADLIAQISSILPTNATRHF
ncbi:hypothetical protein BSY18_3931 (plasmid) [Blastomonas sp. RAC04]|nr:hypothetical protein BSY18_3931 [Blastomonas sp. RAC04]